MTRSDEIKQEYVASGKRLHELVGELSELNATLKPLQKRHNELCDEQQKLERSQRQLKLEYSRINPGSDLRKALRLPTAEAVERAMGALQAYIRATIDEPEKFSLTDIVSFERLAALRDAMASHKAAKDVYAAAT